jgi:hypothetical protein
MKQTIPERTRLAMVEARLAGVHPEWIHHALEFYRYDLETNAVAYLGMMISSIDNYNYKDVYRNPCVHHVHWMFKDETDGL